MKARNALGMVAASAVSVFLAAGCASSAVTGDSHNPSPRTSTPSSPSVGSRSSSGASSAVRSVNDSGSRGLCTRYIAWATRQDKALRVPGKTKTLSEIPSGATTFNRLTGLLGAPAAVSRTEHAGSAPTIEGCWALARSSQVAQIEGMSKAFGYRFDPRTASGLVRTAAGPGFPTSYVQFVMGSALDSPAVTIVGMGRLDVTANTGAGSLIVGAPY